MKEAAGEANMTVITIILIGVIAAVAIPLVNNAMNNSKNKANCNAVGGYMKGAQCCYYSGGSETCVDASTLDPSQP